MDDLLDVVVPDEDNEFEQAGILIKPQAELPLRVIRIQGCDLRTSGIAT